MSYNPKSQGMGINNIGVGDPNVVFKRKNRWTFEIESQGSSCKWRVPTLFIKLAARPNFTIEETEINFLNDKTWIPGKASWENITLTYIDVGGSGMTGDGSEGVRGLYQWLASIYQFNTTNRFQSSKRADYSGRGTLTLYDGCGNPMEEWVLEDMWPQAVQFGDLDMSSSETVDIELTMRYSKVRFRHLCPGLTLQNCCSGC